MAKVPISTIDNSKLPEAAEYLLDMTKQSLDFLDAAKASKADVENIIQILDQLRQQGNAQELLSSVISEYFAPSAAITELYQVLANLDNKISKLRDATSALADKVDASSEPSESYKQLFDEQSI